MTAREDLFAQELLASAKGDSLSPSRKAAMGTALGLGAAGVGMTGAGAAGAVAGKAKLALGLTLVKWLGIVTVGGVAVATATTAIVHHAELEVAPHEERAFPPVTVARPAARPAAPVAVVESAAVAPPAPLMPAVVKTVPRVEPVVEAPAAPAAPVVEAPAPEAAQAAPAAQLSAEQRTIETARRAVADGDLEGARNALAAHDAAFPHGAFAQEVEVLRIELLARSGQHEAARAAASALLARAPESPYASRLRVLVGD